MVHPKLFFPTSVSSNNWYKMKLRKRNVLIPSFSLLLFLSVVQAISVDLYLNRDKFGEYFKLEISEKGCTNVPLNWENQAASLDTHGSCIKFYDLPYCRGKFVALQPYHGTFQDNLATLGFNRIISSASPCGPKLPTGRYYLQNGADGSVLTIEAKNGTPVARTKPFQPYIAKGQQFQLEKVALADYELIPRVHEKLNPITYDMSVSTGQSPVRRTWKIESVYKGKYIIKNEWNNKCLYKAESGKVEEHDCLIWSPNQEWIFRSIKVKPFFPSKDELTKRPLRPDDDFPFDPQSHTSLYLSGGGQRLPPFAHNRVRPSHPAVALGYNTKEKYPPVLPRPILPGPVVIANKNKRPQAPVPHVRHPGLLPFPPEPIVTQPRKPITLEDLKKQAAAAKLRTKKKKKQEEEEDELTSEEKEKKKKIKDEDEEEDDDLTSEEKKEIKKKYAKGKEDEEEEDLNSDEKETRKQDKESDENDEDKKSDEKNKSDETEDKKSEEKGGSDEEVKSEENDDIKSDEKGSSSEKDSDINNEEDVRYDGRHKKYQEELVHTPKYSDFRLYF